MNCHQANRLIHAVLDEDHSFQDEQLLKEHFQHCIGCKEHFHSLQHTIVLLKSTSRLCAPSDFTERLMARLPRETFIQIWVKRLQRHPFLVAASLFVVFMAGSANSLWSQDKQFQLTAYQPQKLEIDKDHNKVIVPADRVVHGDIVVRNADISVEGQVQGNVVAIDGHIYLASTGSVSGDKEEINEVVEWVWYNLKRVVHQLIS
ncbi:MAG TPA: polymer-forming cytoskeletal protein [Bacillota bacterium]|nr:polymer-forming cytoskeletal protein [Bacillota bacterium]